MLGAAVSLYLAAQPGAEQAGDLVEARAQALRARSEPASAEGAWLASMRAAERALRRLEPEWAAAIDRGDDAAGAAGRVGARGAEALYWLALGTMGLARQRGFAALLAAGPAARAAMERAAALAPAIDCAGPHRELGAWLAVIPSAGGGGAGLSRRAFARARALAPSCLSVRVAEAESLAVLLQDRDLFDRLLGEVLAADLPAAGPLRAENQRAQARASALRAERDRLFP